MSVMRRDPLPAAFADRSSKTDELCKVVLVAVARKLVDNAMIRNGMGSRREREGVDRTRHRFGRDVRRRGEAGRSLRASRRNLRRRDRRTRNPGPGRDLAPRWRETDRASCSSWTARADRVPDRAMRKEIDALAARTAPEREREGSESTRALPESGHCRPRDPRSPSAFLRVNIKPQP